MNCSTWNNRRYNIYTVLGFRLVHDGITQNGSTHLKNVPPPVLISLVASDIVEVPEALNRLRSQEVVRVSGLGVKVVSSPRPWLLPIEVGDLGCKVGGLASKRHITRVGQLLGHLEEDVGGCWGDIIIVDWWQLGLNRRVYFWAISRGKFKHLLDATTMSQMIPDLHGSLPILRVSEWLQLKTFLS